MPGVVRVKDLAIGVTIAIRNEAPIMQQYIFALVVVLAGVLGLTGCSEREQATDGPIYVLPTLHWAAQFSVLPAIEKIIASGIDVDVRNSAEQNRHLCIWRRVLGTPKPWPHCFRPVRISTQKTKTA